MRKIYLKNYKGFSEEFIDLMDVNFFVGENSTGKTSILKLINLLSSDKFWIKGDFNTDEVELGYFDEIINKVSSEKTFIIGMETLIDDKDAKTFKWLLFEFGEDLNVPVINKIKTRVFNQDVLIEVSKNQIVYFIKPLENIQFEKWVSDFDFPSKNIKHSLPGIKLPFMIIINFVEIQIYKGIINRNKNYNIIAFPLYNNFTWLAPIRAKPKRIYESYKINFSPEGEHVPLIIRSLFSEKSSKNNDRIKNILENFGKDSNLFDEIIIEEFGKKNSSPFEIDILYNKVPIKLPNVGYGVSQVLPIIVEILASNNDCISIQQPEVHLHPKAQAAFGSFIFNSFQASPKEFLIETHSDFTINRFRYEMMKSENGEKPNSQVLFFERLENGLKISRIKIEKNGEYGSEIPQSYMSFFIDEELKNLEI